MLFLQRACSYSPTLLHIQPHKQGMGEKRWYAEQIAASERGGAQRRRWRSGDVRVFDREQARSLENSGVVLPAGIMQHSTTCGRGEEVLWDAILADVINVLCLLPQKCAGLCKHNKDMLFSRELCFPCTV